MKETEKIFSDYPDIVNVKQMKEMLGICRSVAYQLLQTKVIKSFKLGKVYKIPKQNVINYIMQD